MNQINILELLQLFDFDLRAFVDSRRPACQEDLDRLTEDVKVEIKSRFRKLALQLHPDKSGDAEQFKQLSHAYKTIQDKLRIVQRPQPVVQVIYYSNYGGYTNMNSTTATSFGW